MYGGLILAAILLATHGYQTEPQQTDLRCEFNVVQQVGPPLIAGPLDLVSRVRVLSQPGSPVAILMVDVTGTQITVEKDTSKYDSAFLAEVQNVSDRPLSNILVQMNVEIGNSGGGDGGGSGTELLPGQTVRITSRGAGSSQGPQRSGEDEIGLRAPLIGMLTAVARWYAGGRSAADRFSADPPTRRAAC